MKKCYLLLILISCLLLPSCAINRMAMNMVANALTGDGNSDVFTGDPDPKLVGDAIPFAIKMYEILHSANPKHQDLAVMTGSLFIMYANAYVQGPAEMLTTSEWQAREEGMARAKQLYLRGYDILYDALENKFKGFKQASVSNDTLQPMLRKCKKDDVALLYWAVAGGLSAYSLDIFDFELSARVPDWTAMIHRAYELDPNFGGYSLDEFFIIFYASLPEMLGGNLELAERHFRLALEKSRGNSVSAYVSYAQSVSIPAQDYDTFKDCLDKALAINVDDDVSTRLVNIVGQEKARWLLDNAWTFFSFLPVPDYY